MGGNCYGDVSRKNSLAISKLEWSRIGPLGGSDPSSNLGSPTSLFFWSQISLCGNVQASRTGSKK
jgi:hypothetical protein